VILMNRAQYNAFCRKLPATTHVVQWGGADVWKVGGKVFAIGWFERGTHAGITFKVTPTAYEILREQPGCRPAPYLASRGMKWIQHYAEPGLDAAALRDYIRQSHALVVAKLTRKARATLGLAAKKDEGR
jgi:predicted DNA-binding protein (MmcQ/YjbR family)